MNHLIETGSGAGPWNKGKLVGQKAPLRVHFHTDHSYNDQRIALASTVVRWLEPLSATGAPAERP